MSDDDLLELEVWRESKPEAPEGPWYKDFGSFLCGVGRFPKTFLLRGQAGKGKELHPRWARVDRTR